MLREAGSNWDYRSTRIQAYGILDNQIQSEGGIWIPKGARTHALGRVASLEQQLNLAKRDLLVAELARYYRVAFWGGTKLGPETEEYKAQTDLAKTVTLVRAVENADKIHGGGIDIITGGGPGLMEAANKGVREAINDSLSNGDRIITATSHGVLITSLPNQSDKNEFVTHTTLHHEFGSRLEMFLLKAHGVFVGEGGLGSALELFFAMQLKQVGHIEPEYPIIAHPHWEPILKAAKDQMYTGRAEKQLPLLISDTDLNLVKIEGDQAEITRIFANGYDRWYDKYHRHFHLTEPTDGISPMGN